MFTCLFEAGPELIFEFLCRKIFILVTAHLHDRCNKSNKLLVGRWFGVPIHTTGKLNPPELFELSILD